MKYRPDWPAHFATLATAISHCETFFDWYNHDHHHTGIGLLTPADRHAGNGQRINTAHQTVLDNAHQHHPERFPTGHPDRPANPPEYGSTPPNYTPDNPKTQPTKAANSY